jgi:hypothetical protein
MFDFENYVINIISKFPNRHLVTLQGKLKLFEKENSLYIGKLVSYFSIFKSADFSGLFGQ